MRAGLLTYLMPELHRDTEWSAEALGNRVRIEQVILADRLPLTPRKQLRDID